MTDFSLISFCFLERTQTSAAFKLSPSLWCQEEAEGFLWFFLSLWHPPLLMNVANQPGWAEHLFSCRSWKCFTSWMQSQIWDTLAEFPLTSMGPRLILHETLSTAATCGEGWGSTGEGGGHSSCLAAHASTETRVQARKWGMPYPIAAAGGI